VKGSLKTPMSNDRIEHVRRSAFDVSPDPSLVLSDDGRLLAANDMAERLFGQGLALLTRGRLQAALPANSALAGVLERAANDQLRVREHDVEIMLFGQNAFRADVAATPMGDGQMLLTLHMRGQILDPESAGDVAGLRSVVGLGRMLAHEIKNPLAGIRGAAQLLGTNARLEDQALAQLIVDETERIRRLVDRMESFADEAPLDLQPVNIHQLLDRIRALATNSFAEGIRVREEYDPSLPPVLGDEDMLIQVFLNLVKNASEAVNMRQDGGGEILITTAWRGGVRVRGRNGKQLIETPVEIAIRDNGPGIPAEMIDHLFQPFVTSKPNGVGLGLPLVAKLVSSHGGLIDFESAPGRTRFRVLLPVYSGVPA
jgi:two-component system nitrogen regulation sensor histidine kinase GlnL